MSDIKDENDPEFLLGYQFCDILTKIDNRWESKFWIYPENIERLKAAMLNRNLTCRVCHGDESIGKWNIEYVMMEVEW